MPEQNPEMGTLYTVGYQRRQPEELVALAREQQAIIIDVRRLTQRGKFRDEALSATFEAAGMALQYRKEHHFGNYSGTALWQLWRTENFSSTAYCWRQAFEAALRTASILHSGRDVILLCKEHNVERCHRKTVAMFIAIIAGIDPSEVVHLD